MCHHVRSLTTLAPFEPVPATEGGAAQYLKALTAQRGGRGGGGPCSRQSIFASQLTSIVIQFEGLTSTEYAHHVGQTNAKHTAATRSRRRRPSIGGLSQELSDAASH